MDMKRIVMVVLVALVALTAMFGTPVYAAGKVNINTASKRRLVSLPGIGSDIAELIIKYRREVGPFDNVAELRDIPGIGERRLEGLRNEVTVGQLAEKNL
jgi:competence protein ComEA